MMSAATAHSRLPQAVQLLSRLIATPSFSRDEAAAADIWQQALTDADIAAVERIHNNVWAVAPGFDPAKPTLLLNSHLDTVRPVASYTRDPFTPAIEDERLYGLGSNDAGASGVALAMTFIDICHAGTTLPFNLIFAISAAEEVMAPEGMRALLPCLTERGMRPDMAIVGEPTDLQGAIAERGLLVLDGIAEGKAGHAARGEGINALYRAIDDINRLRRWKPERQSMALGPIQVNVTMIQAGTQHNVVPDSCTYVVDVRTTDAYSNVETVVMLQHAVEHSTLTPRSTHIQASALDSRHPLALSASDLAIPTFISPTTSDMALLHGIPSLKIGPGSSCRSHTANEYVCLSEINQALHLYPSLIQTLSKHIPQNG